MQLTTLDESTRLATSASMPTDVEANEEFLDLEIEELEPRIAYFYGVAVLVCGGCGASVGCDCDCCPIAGCH